MRSKLLKISLCLILLTISVNVYGIDEIVYNGVRGGFLNQDELATYYGIILERDDLLLRVAELEVKLKYAESEAETYKGLNAIAENVMHEQNREIKIGRIKLIIYRVCMVAETVFFLIRGIKTVETN
jgi:hypothetical protein